MSVLQAVFSSEQNAAVMAWLRSHRRCQQLNPDYIEAELHERAAMVVCECRRCRTGAGFSRLGDKIMEWAEGGYGYPVAR